MVREYKSGSNARHHVQTELLQSLSATAPLMGGKRSECTEVLWRSVSSQSRHGGDYCHEAWGRCLMKEEQRLKVGLDGGFFPSLQQVSGQTSQKQVSGTYGKPVGKRLRG